MNKQDNGKYLTIKPSLSLRGSIGPEENNALPGDKSLSHRAALFSALAEGESRVENFLVSGVTQAMLGALTVLGVEWNLAGDNLIVKGKGSRALRPAAVPLDCENSATTMRLLAGVIAATGLPAVLDGSSGLRNRPMNRIVDPLKAMGVPVSSNHGAAPLEFLSRRQDQPLQPIDHILPVASAQVKSCLLFAGLAANGQTILREPGPSRDHTERMLRAIGIPVRSEIDVSDSNSYITILDQSWIPGIGIQEFKPLQLRLPCDISSAAFLMVAALITQDSEIIIRNVGLNPTRTGLIDALLSMGADLLIQPTADQCGEPVGDIYIKSSTLHSTEISGSQVVRMIDEFPVFAVAAAFASGTTRVSQAEELRYKESDRISALCNELRKLGVDISETSDGFLVTGGKPLYGGLVEPHGDHRLAMSLTVAGLGCKDKVSVKDAQIINESFPEFIPILQSLGATLEVG